jgi:hypothetical protein
MPSPLTLGSVALVFLLFQPDVSRATHLSWVGPAIETCEALGVPGVLALAVILTESLGQPYAVRINHGTGVSRYPSTVQAAEQVTLAALTQTDNLDVGLMQVNYRHHGRRHGVTPTDLIHPQVNLRVGCTVLQEALVSGGSLWERIGRYHSPHPARQRAYAQRVRRWLMLLTQEPTPHGTSQPPFSRIPAPTK